MRPFAEADARAGEAVRPPRQAMRPVLEAKRPVFTGVRGVARASCPSRAARRAARFPSEPGRKGFTVQRDTSDTGGIVRERAQADFQVPGLSALGLGRGAGLSGRQR
jgi:hypothetical protein